MWRVIQSSLAVLGALTGALSAASLLQRLLAIGLKPIFHDLLEFYRNLTRVIQPFVDWLPLEFWDVALAPWYSDALIVSFIGSGVIVRGALAQEISDNGWTIADLNRPEVSKIVVALYALATAALYLFMVFSLLGCLALLAPAGLLVTAVIERDQLPAMVRINLVLIGILVALGLFFALNAYI